MEIQNLMNNFTNLNPKVYDIFSDSDSFYFVIELQSDASYYEYIPWGKPINWNFNIYIDACHSGSAVKKFRSWCKYTSTLKRNIAEGIKLEKQDALKDIECDQLYYFDHNCEL